MTTQGRFVCPGGPADGRLVPGDQLVKINNVAVDDLTPEQAAEIIRSAHANTKHRLKCLNVVAFSAFSLFVTGLTITARPFVFFRECRDTLTMTVLRIMHVSLLVTIECAD